MLPDSLHGNFFYSKSPERSPAPNVALQYVELVFHIGRSRVHILDRRLYLEGFFCGFSQSLQINPSIMSPISPRPLLSRLV